MQDALGPNTILGYCTNVHAGPTLAETKANLDTHAVAVKQSISPDAPMGVGLWLAQPAAHELLDSHRVEAFRDWLGERDLVPFTFNGFPYGDFHETVVKRKVYHPTWAERARLEYTLDLAHIQAQLLGNLGEGGISTLPIGWRDEVNSKHGAIEAAAKNLIALADALHQIEQETGKLIHVDIEPEPGCYLDTSSDVVSLFTDHLLRQGNESRVRRHLRVCHDICHAAVMFESQTQMIDRYSKAGILIGKVQVSCAVRAPFDRLRDDERADAFSQLKQFREPRYMHQTVARRADGTTAFFNDLPDAIASVNAASAPREEWRTHFHVPLFLDRFGLLEATQEQVLECLALLRSSGVRHYEAETYAWNVLPDELRTTRLADGIARELQWLMKQARQEASA